MVGTKGHKVIQNIPPLEIVEKIMAAPKTLTDKLLVYGLIYTGMRVGEFVHMRREWIRWDLNKIYIPREQPCSICQSCRKERYKKKREAGKWTGEWVLVKPANTWRAKTDNAVRSINISPELKAVLSEFFAEHKAVQEVFPYRELAWTRLKQLSKEAGVKWRLFPHLVRGIVASKLASQKVDVYRLKEIMGWKDIDVAAEYVKLYRPSTKEEVVKW